MGCMARQIQDDPKPTALGTNLKRIRTERRITQAQLAERAGVSRATVIAIESGASDNPETRTVAALAKALGIPQSEISQGPVVVAPDTADGRISLTEFLSVARGVLEVDDVRKLEKLRTRLDPRGLTRRDWLRTVMVLRDDDTDDEVG